MKKSTLLNSADERVHVDCVDEFGQMTLLHLYFEWDSGFWKLGIGILGSSEHGVASFESFEIFRFIKTNKTVASSTAQFFSARISSVNIEHFQ